MAEAPQARSRDVSLFAYVALGVVAGVIYIAFDLLSESKIERGTLTGWMANAHELIDHTFPVLVGALLGVLAHYLRLRAQLSTAQAAASRAEALRSRLQKVERDQAVWVLAAAVLHELNNPLHNMVLLLDEAIDCADNDPRRMESVRRARTQAERAQSHLKALRSVGVAGEPDFQRVALDRVVRALASDVGSLAAEEGLIVQVECAEAVEASADPTYVRTILENLLDNSLTSLRDRKSGCITMRLAVEQGRAVVRVCDDGPPVDPSVRATLFEPLRTTKRQGLGLGLPIARALARAMQGDLSLDSHDEKVFRLELPLPGAA
jgi:two-component system C4-dicarboxylate transport sensor histidine kinase DctB